MGGLARSSGVVAPGISQLPVLATLLDILTRLGQSPADIRQNGQILQSVLHECKSEISPMQQLRCAVVLFLPDTVASIMSDARHQLTPQLHSFSECGLQEEGFFGCLVEAKNLSCCSRHEDCHASHIL